MFTYESMANNDMCLEQVYKGVGETKTTLQYCHGPHLVPPNQHLQMGQKLGRQYPGEYLQVRVQKGDGPIICTMQRVIDTAYCQKHTSPTLGSKSSKVIAGTEI